MAASSVQLAKRALVTLLLALAATYNVVVNVTRDSVDGDVLKAFKKVSLKAHPDKGGSPQDMQRLVGARDAWETAKKAAPRYLQSKQ